MWTSLAFESFWSRPMLSQSIRLTVYGNNLGYSYTSGRAGEAVVVGEGVADISDGQHFFAHVLGLKIGKLENSSFQKYVCRRRE